MIQAALLALTVSTAPAQDWSGFRGRNGQAATEARGLPTTFGPGQNMSWRTEVPFGRSSPILTRDAVIVTGADADALSVTSLERASGAVRWTRKLARLKALEVFPANDSASPTPVTDGVNVHVFFPELGLVSFDGEGRERWRLPLGPFVNFYGMSSSPVLAGDTLVLLCDQQQGSYLLAVDARTGKERWRTPRPESSDSWTTPVVYPAGAPEQVLVSGGYRVSSYSLATGEERWTLGGFGYGPTPSPTLIGDTLYACTTDHTGAAMPPYESFLADHDKDKDGVVARSEVTGDYADHFGWLDVDKDDRVVGQEYEQARAAMASKDFGFVAIDLAAEGGPAERWRYRKGLPDISSPLVHAGVAYLVRGSGLVTTLDAASGEPIARERLPDAMSECYPSAVAADGKVYLLDNAGHVAVLAEGREWRVLASNELGEECFVSPAIGADGLYIRSRSAVYRFVIGRSAAGAAGSDDDR